MKGERLIEKYKKLEGVWDAEGAELARQIFLQDLEQLDESETGHADEAPRYVKNILARLRELPLHDREVWLKAIMSEFEQDFSRAKWREGYEQGKFDGEWVGNQLKAADKIRQELNKPVIPQFVADWLSNLKSGLFGLNYDSVSSEIYDWVYHTEDNIRKLHLAFVYGYEVEKEKRYRVKMKRVSSDYAFLNRNLCGDWFFYCKNDSDIYHTHHTRKELEEANFGWVFDCSGVEVQEVED